jgi:mannose-6-phosphate isomerase-like protein (cupin superfamily)
MIIRNAFDSPRRIGPSRHGGTGVIEQCRVFEKPQLKSSLNIVAFDLLPPGSSIGVHSHPNEEEVYIILQGIGTMTVDAEQRRVVEGDMILTQPGSSHALLNDGKGLLKVVAIEVKTDG